MSVKILHFADAHIDSYSGGRIDPQKGLAVHTVDFLNALDEIVETAVSENVQLVLFAGDAYRSPIPVPTFQREWQRRVMRLSNARIPLLMIPGNHDISPNTFRASSLQELDTLQIPFIHLAAKGIHLYTPEELDGGPVQVLAVPWIPVSRFAAREEFSSLSPEERALKMESEINARVRKAADSADPRLPLILMAHYSVNGAAYPSGQTAEPGRDVNLSRALVCDPVFSYTALGHIHLFQDLNEGQQPPVIYSGSIERVDYGEAREKKGFIIADVANHQTQYEFRELHSRPMYNLKHEVKSAETMQQELLDLLPPQEKIPGAMIRLEFSYPHEWESSYSERELRSYAAGALDFQLKRKPRYTGRIRIQNKNVGSLTPGELLQTYCDTTQIPETEARALAELAENIFKETENQEH